MSRSGYSDDEIDQWDLIRWRGAVKSAIRGKRGQAFLAEMLEALDAMPEKRLIANDLRDRDGEVCALGAVGLKRRMHLALIDPEEPDEVAEAFGIASALAAEIAYENDELDWRWDGKKWERETPEVRWRRMHDWVKSRIGNQHV